jgi:hypothetical protein
LALLDLVRRTIILDALHVTGKQSLS